MDFYTEDALSMLGGDNFTEIENNIATLDASVVHLAGTETITGTKTFTQNTRIGNNGSSLQLVGSDHCYVSLYPDTFSAGRKGYVGYPNATSNDISITNDIGGVTLNASTLGSNLITSATGNNTIQTASGGTGNNVISVNNTTGYNRFQNASGVKFQTTNTANTMTNGSNTITSSTGDTVVNTVLGSTKIRSNGVDAISVNPSGIATFTSLPECSVVPTTANQLVNKTYADGLVSGAGAVLITGTQTITGDKTFGGTTTYTGNIVANALTITPTELGYLDGATSNIQAQINLKANDNAVVHLTGTETITGNKTFSGITTVNNSLLVSAGTAINYLISASTIAIANLIEASSALGGNRIRCINGGSNEIITGTGVNSLTSSATSGNANLLTANGGGNNQINASSGNNVLNSTSGNNQLQVATVAKITTTSTINTLNNTTSNKIQVGGVDKFSCTSTQNTFDNDSTNFLALGVNKMNMTSTINTLNNTASNKIQVGGVDKIVTTSTTNTITNANTNVVGELFAQEYGIGASTDAQPTPLINFCLTGVQTDFNVTTFYMNLGGVPSGDSTANLIRRFGLPFNAKPVGFSISGDDTNSPQTTFRMRLCTGLGGAGTVYYDQTGTIGLNALRNNSFTANLYGNVYGFTSVTTTTPATIPAGERFYCYIETLTSALLTEFTIAIFFQQMI